MTALRTEDPAVAAAMGRCLTARSLARKGEAFGATTRHPRTCGWCDYPADELQAAVIEFRNWAEFNDRLGTSGRHATRAFSHELSREQQEALIVAAQAFVEEESPGGMGVKSSDDTAGIGPRGSLVSGETGSNLPPAEPVPAPEPPPPDVEEDMPSWLR